MTPADPPGAPAPAPATARRPTRDRAVALVVPAGTDLRTLARAWFADADWLRTPAEAATARVVRRTGGARFRGAPVEVDAVSGLLGLLPGVVVEGPLPPGRGTPAPVGVASDAYLLPPYDAAHAWAAAVARHVGGGLAEGSAPPLATGPESSLARLVLYSPNAADAATVAVWVRSVLPAAHLRGEEPAARAFTLQHDLAYDGTVVVDARPAGAGMPPALRGLGWCDVGPHTITVAWLPADHDASRPLDTMDLLCLRRAAPWLARTTAVLQGELGGTVLDGDGFVVAPRTLAAIGRAR